MFIHCNKRTRTDEVLFLRDSEEFTDRRLETAECPVCGHMLARLIETRIADNKVFDVLYTRWKADKVIKDIQGEIEYSSLDSVPVRGSLYGFRYGQNIERRNKKNNEVTIIQKACDFHGNKEVVKEVTKPLFKNLD